MCMLCVDEVQRIVFIRVLVFPSEYVRVCGFELQRATQHESENGVEFLLHVFSSIAVVYRKAT